MEINLDFGFSESRKRPGQIDPFEPREKPETFDPFEPDKELGQFDPGLNSELVSESKSLLSDEFELTGEEILAANRKSYTREF